MSEYNAGCRLPSWVREILNKLQDTVHEAPTISRDAVTVKRSVEQDCVVENVRIVVDDKIVYHDD